MNQIGATCVRCRRTATSEFAAMDWQSQPTAERRYYKYGITASVMIVSLRRGMCHMRDH